MNKTVLNKGYPSDRRKCSACGGICHWYDTAWVCERCGSEWVRDHGTEYLEPSQVLVRVFQPRQAGLVYRGQVIAHINVAARETWQCTHGHRLIRTAYACAERAAYLGLYSGGM